MATAPEPSHWPLPALTSRRGFLGLVATSVLAEMGCGSSAQGSARQGRLVVPNPSPSGRPPTGLQRLGLGPDRDGSLYVPSTYSSEKPTPLLLLLHGAGQSASLWFGSYGERAEAAGMIVLAPESRGPTWDAIREGFGVDVAFINAALDKTCAQYNVDSARLALGGFSDGASYALSLGLINGDLFPNVIAYSPGFVVDGTHRGSPSIFVSHGKEDPILPIDVTSRPLVAALRQAGYTVDVTEFEGHHEIPPAVSDAAMHWLAEHQRSSAKSGRLPP